MTVIEQEIQRIASNAKYPIGVSATHIESGRHIGHNHDQTMVLASTYKVPMAITALRLVEQGKLSLDQQIVVEHMDYIGPGPLGEWLTDPGTQLPLKTLISLMLIHSDNSATDVVFRTIGGAPAIAKTLGELGLSDLTVSRPTAQLIVEYFDCDELNQHIAGGLNTQQALDKLMASDGGLERWNTMLAERANDKDWIKQWINDPRDKGTAEAMTQLLVQAFKAEAIDQTHADLLWQIMGKCVTGANRIRAMLPAGTPVADKTGTLYPIAGGVNDTGIITLPDNKGHIALSVFCEIYGDDFAACETHIAQISRAIYDYFLFTSDE